MFGRRRDIALHEAINRQNEELRAFIREITLRNEKVWQAAIAELSEMKDAIHEMKEELHEGREQLKANTRAVLIVLDRLEGSGGEAGA